MQDSAQTETGIQIKNTGYEQLVLHGACSSVCMWSLIQLGEISGFLPNFDYLKGKKQKCRSFRRKNTGSLSVQVMLLTSRREIPAKANAECRRYDTA